MTNQLEKAIQKIPLLSSFPTSKIHVQALAGLTNKNFLLSVADKQYVLRIPQKNTNHFINRNNEAHNANIAQQLGIAPKILWQEKKQGQLTGLSLSHYLKNSHSIKCNDTQSLEKLAGSLHKLHRSKEPFKSLLDPQAISKQIRLYFESGSKAQQRQLTTDYQKTQQLLEQMKTSDRPFVPSHIDLVAENVLIQKINIWIIDWEYSAMASPFWDIATFCNAENFSENKAHYLLRKVLKTELKHDKKQLTQYRQITKTMTRCWEVALNKITVNSDRHQDAVF